MTCGYDGQGKGVAQFISDACKSVDLTSRFLAFENEKEFKTWLEAHNYKFTDEEIGQMLRARRDHLSNAEVGITSY
jgi:hypothetical protein